MRKLLILPLLATIVFASCNKGENKDYSIQPIKKIISDHGDSVYYQQFLYNASGQLISKTDSNKNGNQSAITPVYDAQGRLSGYTTASRNWTFQYDNNGRIIKKQSTPAGTAPYNDITVYTYNNSGALIADTTYSIWTSNVSYYRTFTYDQQGNLVTYKRYLKAGSNYQLDENVQMQYSDHPSAYYTVKNLFYMMEWGSEQYLSPNICISETYPDGLIVNYSYQYYGDGSPGGCVVSDNDGSAPEHLSFFY